ncbi:MAG: DUF6159 family protein [Burkholderiales bacterium]
MKRCPKCTKLMPDDVTRCIACGFDAKPAASPTSRPAAPPAAVFAKPPAAQPASRPAGPPPANQPKVGKIRNGLALAAQSWRVLMLDKSLLLFPLASGIACFLVLASFVGGAFAIGLAHGKGSDALHWALLLAYYFANYFVIVFFNSALVACAMIRFRGGDPTLADGLRAASARFPQIAAWALLAATVGVVLRFIEERVGFIGKIVIALLGAAWTIANYFVVPVLVVEKLGPLDAAKRSVDIIKKTWGESIVSNAGVGLATFLAVLLLVIPCGVATLVLALKAGSLTLGIAGGAATLGLLILIVLASSAIKSIILSAIYLYATESKVPQAFEAVNLQQAFAAR